VVCGGGGGGVILNKTKNNYVSINPYPHTLLHPEM
jgi:hypothetical protein